MGSPTSTLEPSAPTTPRAPRSPSASPRPNSVARSVQPTLKRGNTTESIVSAYSQATSIGSTAAIDSFGSSWEATTNGSAATGWGVRSFFPVFGGSKAVIRPYDSPENAVIIFDWDDTLCPTYWSTQRSMGEKAVVMTPRPSQAPELAKNAEIVVNVLRAARQVARVAIVTLATPEWVVLTMRRVFPDVNFNALLAELGIVIYYAPVPRTFPTSGPDPRVTAKKKAMSKCLQTLYSRSARGQRWNVVSVGDALYEQVALKSVCKDNAKHSPICKTVKFVDEPTLEQLGNQLEMLAPNLARLVKTPKDKDWTSTSLSIG